MTSAPLEQRGAGATGREAHLSRVSAWCREVARKQGFPKPEVEALLEAAQRHHLPDLVTELRPEQDLTSLLGLAGNVAPGRKTSACGGKHSQHLASILEICDQFDESLELEPIDPEFMPALEQRGRLAAALRFAEPPDLARLIRDLPVFPAVAHQAMDLISSDRAGFREIERLVSSDPVLAGEIVRSANTAEYASRQPITSIRHALSFIGAARARRIVFAAAIRPVFRSPRSQNLWNHSLEVATAAEAIARTTRAANTDEAFLAGLVHDVGRLAILRDSSERAESLDRLLQSGCPACEAEFGLYGCTHAEVGRMALARWGFPPQVTSSVALHHSPERTTEPLASILYLAEDVCCNEEDLPSAIRLCYAHKRLGLGTKPIALPVLRMTMSTLAELRFAG